MGRSDAQSREFSFEISEHLFRLTSESLRLYSNETLEYQTLGSLIAARSAGKASLDSQDDSTLQEHLAVIPTQGSVRIALDVSKDSCDYIESVRAELSVRLRTNLTFCDAVSLLLFDYVVERNSRRLLDLLEIDQCLPSRRIHNFNGSRH